MTTSSTSATETSGPNNLKAKRGGLDISRSFSSTRTAFPRSESASTTKTKKAINKVAPIPVADTALTKLPPNMVTLVEGFLKEFQNEGHANHNNIDNKGQNVDNMTTADELPPDEISVSLCKLGRCQNPKFES